MRKDFRKYFFYIFFLIFSSTYSFAQNVAINTTGSAANASAGLDVNFTSKGLLIPRVTNCQRTTPGCAGGMLDGSGNLPAAAQGLLVYQTDGTQGFYYNTSTTVAPTWVYLFASGTGPRWDQILAPTSNLSLAHVGNTTTFSFNAVAAASAFSMTSSSLTTGRILDLQSTSTTLANVTLNSENSSNDGFSVRAYNKSTTAASVANFGGRVASVFAQTDAPNTIGVFANAAGTSQSIGVWGAGSGSASSIGVLGIGNAQGYSILASGAGGYFIGSTYGTYSTTSANGGTGVYGINTSTGTSSQYGIYGEKSGATGTGTGYGVYGTATGTAAANYGGYFTSSGATTDNFGVYGLTSGSVGGNAGVYGYTSASGVNTGFGSSQITSGIKGRHNWGRSYHFGVAGYVYNDLSSYPYGGVFGAATVSDNPSVWGALGYRENASTEYGGFFNGNSRTTGYLLVGNPTAPNGVGIANTTFYHIQFNNLSYWNYVARWCAPTTNWYVGSSSGYQNYVAIGGPARSLQQLHSPFIWVPNGFQDNTMYFQLNHQSSLETNWDGVYLEWYNGSSWAKVSSWSAGNYNGTATGGSTTGCGAENIIKWTNGFSQQTSTSNALTISKNKWIQLRLTASEDASGGAGLEYRIYELWIKGTMDFYSPGFMPGGIYAEGHVYAQSSAQLGDIAEFFPVSCETTPGDLISMDPKGSKLCYVSFGKMDPYVIGVHSSSPSVLVNSPSQGIPVGLTGRVPVNVVDENGNISPGDFLTSSSVKGYAMKAKEPCFVVGRAMEVLDSVRGQVIAMINPGWYNPNPNSESVSSGNYFVIPGQKSIKVFDGNISQFSKIFVSMRSNPQSYFWISSVSDGAFEIEFEKIPESKIPFDYLVNNATFPPVIETQKSAETSSEKMIKTEKNLNEKDNLNIDAAWTILGNNDKLDISRITMSQNPPSPPPDPSKFWTWDSINGFVEQKETTNTQESRTNQKDTLEKPEPQK